MIKNKMSILKSAPFLLLLAGICLNPQTGRCQSKEVIYSDTHREMPGLTDFGAYQTYKISPEEVKKLEPQKLREIVEIYIRRYYDYYMYFSRNIIVEQCSENYPSDLLDPVISDYLKSSDMELRKMVTAFFNSEGGVTKENQRINSLLVPIMHDWEIKKFGSVKSPKRPPFHSPNAIYLAYLKKIGLRDMNYAPPFYPKGMDPNEEENKKKSDRWIDIIMTNKLITHTLIFLMGLFSGILVIKKKKLIK